jgi:hypothetical protein
MLSMCLIIKEEVLFIFIIKYSLYFYGDHSCIDETNVKAWAASGSLYAASDEAATIFPMHLHRFLSQNIPNLHFIGLQGMHSQVEAWKRKPGSQYFRLHSQRQVF